MNSGKFEIRSGVTAKKLSGETVILDVESGNYFGLNAVGSRIWELIEEGNDVAVICETILGEYKVEADVAQRDVRQLVDDLKSRGLIEATRY